MDDDRPLDQHRITHHCLDPLRFAQHPAGVLRLVDFLAFADELLGRDAELLDDRSQLRRVRRRLEVQDDGRLDAPLAKQLERRAALRALRVVVILCLAALCG